MIDINKELYNHLVLSQYYNICKEPDFKKRFELCASIANKYRFGLLVKLTPIAAIPLISATFATDNPAVSIPCAIGSVVLLMLWWVAYHLVTSYRTSLYIYLNELTRRDMMLASIRASWLNISETEECKKEIDDYYQGIVDKVHEFCGENIKKNSNWF